MKSFVIVIFFSLLFAFTIGHPQRIIDEDPDGAGDGALNISI